MNKCSICKNRKGKLSKEYCRDNEKSPHYDGDLFGSTDIYDCWNFLLNNETKKRTDYFNQPILDGIGNFRIKMLEKI